MKLADLYVPSSPKYLALADAVERGVAGGLLAPGEALPTQRELAGALGVTVGTVTRAYAETARRGLTVGITGRGTFIAEARPDVDILTEDAVLGGPDLPGPADGAAGRGGTGPVRNLGFIAPFERLNPSLGEALARLAGTAKGRAARDLCELQRSRRPGEAPCGRGALGPALRRGRGPGRSVDLRGVPARSGDHPHLVVQARRPHRDGNTRLSPA